MTMVPTSRDILFRLASNYRVAIEKAFRAGVINDIILNRFPKGCCGDASLLLSEYLRENEIETDYVCGSFLLEGEDQTQSHAWLEFGKNIIDITGDQFRRRKPLFYDVRVYVGEYDHMHSLFKENVQSRHPANLELYRGQDVYYRLKEIATIIQKFT